MNKKTAAEIAIWGCAALTCRWTASTTAEMFPHRKACHASASFGSLRMSCGQCSTGLPIRRSNPSRHPSQKQVSASE